MEKYRYTIDNSIIEVKTIEEVPQGLIYETIIEEPINQFEIDSSKIQLFESYPDLAGLNYKLLNLDNLPDIKRQETLANKEIGRASCRERVSSPV